MAALSWITRGRRLIGLIILVVLLLRIDLTTTRAALAQANITPLLLAYCLFVPTLLLRSLRWRLLLREQNISLPLAHVLSIYSYSILLGSVTPGRMGEFVKVLEIQRLGHSPGVSLLTVLVDRTLDVLLLLAAGGAMLVVLLVPIEWRVLSLLVLTAALIGCLLLLPVAHTALHNRRLPIWLARLLPPDDTVQTGLADNNNRGRIGRLSGTTLAQSLVLTAFAWMGNFSAVYLLTCALGLQLGYVLVLGLAAVCALVALLPISVLGLGTRDLALVQLLQPLGVDPGVSLALSTLILSMLLVNAMCCVVPLLLPGLSPKSSAHDASNSRNV